MLKRKEMLIMKKSLSIILAVIMMLSCLMTLVVGASAETITYPNGRTQILHNIVEEVGYHRITDSFYMNQNCFTMKGLVRMYSNYSSLFQGIIYQWSYVVKDTAGNRFLNDDLGQFNYTDVYTYVDGQVTIASNISVAEIKTTHTIVDPRLNVTASTLTAEYSPN